MIAQLLQMDRNRRNSFLGVSPFESNKPESGVGRANETLFFIDKKGDSHYYDLRRKQRSLAQNLWHAIHLTHVAELNGKMVMPE